MRLFTCAIFSVVCPFQKYLLVAYLHAVRSLVVDKRSTYSEEGRLARSEEFTDQEQYEKTHAKDLAAAQVWLASAREAPAMQESNAAGAQSAGILTQVPQSRPLRILVTCLQSSGCTLFTKLLGQVDRTVAFLDTHIYVPTWKFPTPNVLDTKDARFVILKTTIQGREVVEPTDRLQQIKSQFRPDRTILFIRNPSENLAHLREHVDASVDKVCEPKPFSGFGYASRCGSPQDKLRALEVLWESREDIFDVVVSYADLVGDETRRYEVTKAMNLIGFPLGRDHFAMQKNNEQITQYARDRMGNATFAWSTGDVVDGPIRSEHVQQTLIAEKPPAIDGTVAGLCPQLMASNDNFRSTVVHAESPLDSDAVSWFKARAGKAGQVIILFVNADYADTLLNWFAVGKRKGSVEDNYAVVCLDDVTEALLRAHGEECLPGRPRFFKSLDGSLVALGPLWMFRVRILQALLDAGLDVVLTDSDALWLKNPLPAINQIISISGADIVSSRGRSPDAVARQWGATACMGFIFFRASNPTRLLMKEMLLFARKSMIYDDQILLNTVLFNVGLKFSRNLTLEGSTDVDIGVTNVATSSATLALLPHDKYMRFCSKDGLEDVVIAHCESDNKYGSTGHAKRDGLASNGLWLLPKRWPTSFKETSFNSWISALTQTVPSA